MSDTSPKISELRNMGTVSAAWLSDIRINTLDDLQKIGVVNAYKILKEKEYGVSLNLLWGMQAALMDIDWRDIPEELKEKLKKEL